MNRKMRSKLNNQQAKAKKERRSSCSKEGQVFESEFPTCEECGTELVPVAAVVIEVVQPSIPKEKLH